LNNQIFILVSKNGKRHCHYELFEKEKVKNKNKQEE